jgi:hypothetical protein
VSIFPEAIRTPFHKAYYNAMKTKKEIIIEDYFTLEALVRKPGNT